MKEQKETFAQITAEFIGKPYGELGFGPESYGCVGFCYAFLKRIGKVIDESVWEYEGLTTSNFMEKWRQNPEETVALMLTGLERIGAEVPVKRKLAGDLVIIKTAHGKFYPAIYVGNSNIMASYYDRGVRVFTIDNKALTVVKVRRL